MAECVARTRALREFTKHLPPVEAWQLERETFLWAGSEATAPTSYAYHCVTLLHYLEGLQRNPQVNPQSSPATDAPQQVNPQSRPPTDAPQRNPQSSPQSTPATGAPSTTQVNPATGAPRHPVTQLPWLPPDVLHGRQSTAAEASQCTHRRRWDTLRALRDVKLVVPDDVQGGMRCRKCRSNDLLVETHQTRAADEGMTQFVTCRACGARW
jgi:hypothetical protein